ncbi:MAG: 7TM diverse intracellular signaling domain-containing protein [Bacteroidia bacterium]
MVKKSKVYKYLLIVLILFGFTNDGLSQVVYKNATKNLQIGKDILYLEDKANNLTINDILKTNTFAKDGRDVPNFGITSSSIWAKVTVRNESGSNDLVLQINQPIIDEVSFYYFEPKVQRYEVIEMGENKPFSLRKYLTPEYIFDLKLPRGVEKTYYLKIKARETMQLPITIGSSKSLFEFSGYKNLASGIYIGIMIVMLLYNLFIFGTVREKSYLMYTLYIIFVLFAQTSNQGLPFQFVWPNLPWLETYSQFLFPALAGIAGLEFFKDFLQLKTRNPKVYKFSFLFIIPYVLSMILSFTGNYGASFQIMSMTASSVALFMLIFGIIIYRQGNQEARFFLIGWSIFLAGVVIFVLKDQEVLPYNTFTRYTMHFGSGAEVILLSFALADRINILKREKELSQAQVVEALKENEKLITEQNVILEEKVQIRTEELEVKNSELGVALTDLKEAQSQLVVVEKMASLGQLTAGIAHEINNPINFVSANVKPLQMDIADIMDVLKKYESITPEDNIQEKLASIESFKKEIDLEYVKTEINTLLGGIEDGAKRTAEIVKGLKNFSHLDESDIKEADVNQGVESTLVLLRSTCPPNIEIVKNLGQLPMIECYPGKLNQVFMNIINNAIQAMDKCYTRENHTLTLSTFFKDEHVHVCVEDTGLGMSPEVKAKIFEPFFTTKDVGEGTGLGMSIVFGIIESHHAKIDIDTELGRGTKMTIILPMSLNLTAA